MGLSMPCCENEIICARIRNWSVFTTPYSPDTRKALENHHLGTSIQIERKMLPSNAMIETLAARVKLAIGQTEEALDIYQAALRIFPHHRALVYDYADALLRNNDADNALKFVSQQLQFTPNDIRLYRLQAQSYAALGNVMARIARRRKFIHGRAIIMLPLNNCRSRCKE